MLTYCCQGSVLMSCQAQASAGGGQVAGERRDNGAASWVMQLRGCNGTIFAKQKRRFDRAHGGATEYAMLRRGARGRWDLPLPRSHGDRTLGTGITSKVHLDLTQRRMP